MLSMSYAGSVVPPRNRPESLIGAYTSNESARGSDGESAETSLIMGDGRRRRGGIGGAAGVKLYAGAANGRLLTGV